MIHFSYTGQGETLCGETQLEADLKDGKLCDVCIQIMWKEQYRRNTLNKLVKFQKKTGIKTTPEQKEKVTQHQLKRLKRPIALPPHRGIAKKKLFLKDWKTYGGRT